MPLYSFTCKVCEYAQEFDINIKDAPRVGTSISLTPELTSSPRLDCPKCNANLWTRTWPSKTSGFRFAMRRTSL